MSEPYLPVEERPLGWREKALRALDPLSREAFRIRATPQSLAEREYWEAEFKAIERDLRFALRRERREAAAR